MKISTKAVIAAALLVLALHPGLLAAIKLPALIGNHMVLQQNTIITVWGWAEPGEIVKINPGWTTESYITNTDSAGNWNADIKTPKAGGPYLLSLTGRDHTITITDIMIGEVWVCSGQSNMEFQLRWLSGWDFYKPEIKQSVVDGEYPGVRFFTVQRDTSEKQLVDCKGHWSMADTGTINDFSATAWFFGSYLSKQTGFPVGLISAAWGGTPAEVWAPADKIKQNEDLSYFMHHWNGSQWWPGTHGVLFNAMIYPLLKFKIKGAIWYQGETNHNDTRFYPQLMNTLISSWREAWNCGDFPFYYVQVAPFTYSEPVSGALLREAQLKCLSVNNTGMAVTLDIAGDVTDIHPKNKLDVGKRLALLALNNDYGIKICSSGPVYKSNNVQQDKMIVSFDNACNWLTVASGDENNFKIAGNDRVFYPAKVIVDRQNLIVSSPKVKQPVALRYAFENTSTASLFNSEGLPASSFRTDDWNIITDKVKLSAIYDESTRKIAYQLSTAARETDIYYSFDKAPDKESACYHTYITPEKSGILYASVARDGYLSDNRESWRIVKNAAESAVISYKNLYSGKFTAGGVNALNDGICGSTNFDDGFWQGFEGNNLDAVIDFGNAFSCKSVSCNFLCDIRSWVFLPKSVKLMASDDGINYYTIESQAFGAEYNHDKASIREITFSLKKSYRYIRVEAVNQGKCPEWHSGRGQKCWMMIDEIIIKIK